MPTFDSLEQEWIKHRARLEREIRALVVHDGPDARKDLEGLLYRCHISSRSVPSTEGLVEAAGRGHFSLLLLGSHMAGMEGMALVQSLRQELPELDVMLVAHDLVGGPTRGRAATDLVRQCLASGVLDVIAWPVELPEQACERIRVAVERNVNRRMRAHVLRQIRAEMGTLDEETRGRVTASLEHRLGELRRWIGGFDRVLVSEGMDPGLRSLSELLLVGGMQVEAADTDTEAWARVDLGGLHMVVMDRRDDKPSVDEALASVRRFNPLGELLLATREPRLTEALEALRVGVPLYIPWPPADPALVVKRIQRIRQQCLRERLLDSLLAALFLETHDEGARDTAAYDRFCELAGMERRLPQEALLPEEEGLDDAPADGVVDEILEGQPDVEAPPLAGSDPLPAAQGEHERRQHPRVMENQFVRFRLAGTLTSTLAYLGDLSEGGVFIRSASLPEVRSALQVDVNIEHEGLGYLVRCQGVVAWTAEDDSRVPYGPGFGVRFVDPPAEVTLLLQRVIAARG